MTRTQGALPETVLFYSVFVNCRDKLAFIPTGAKALYLSYFLSLGRQLDIHLVRVMSSESCLITHGGDNIRICHKRKIRSEDHRLASRGLPSDDKW